MKDKNTVCGTPVLALLQHVIPNWLFSGNGKGIPGSLNGAQTIELNRIKTLRNTVTIAWLLPLLFLFFIFLILVSRNFQFNSGTVFRVLVQLTVSVICIAYVVRQIWKLKQESRLTVSLKNLNVLFLENRLVRTCLSEPLPMFPLPNGIFLLPITSRANLTLGCEKLLCLLANEVIFYESEYAEDTAGIVLRRNNFSKHFEAASAFGFAQDNWKPYFAKARAQYLTKYGTPETEVKSVAPHPSGPGATVAF